MSYHFLIEYRIYCFSNYVLYILVKHYQPCSPNCYSFAVCILVSFLFLFYLNVGEAKKLAVTKVVTLRDFGQNDPSPPPEKWVKCYRVDDSFQELSTNSMKDWEFPDDSRVLLHIDVQNQQLYHLPLLITPVHCVYLVTFDLRDEEKALKRIHEAMKLIFPFVSYSSKSLLENYSPPKVLLVGTHKTNDQKIQFVQKLRESLKKYRDWIVKPDDEEFWAVDDDCIDIRNRDIFNEVRLHSWQPQVPTCQCIEYGSELLQKFLEKTVVLPNVSSAEVKKFLAFLHDYGFIVYHPYQELDDDTPVIQPQYLCKLFATAQELRKKWGGEVTIEGLFSSDAKLEHSMKKWFEMFCIRMGLVIEQPMGDGRNLVFVLSRQLRSETSSLASHINSVDPLLVTYVPPKTKDIDCYIPPRFFPAFASAFLKVLNDYEECKDKFTVSIEPAHIVVDWDVGCCIHVLEQESCVEIGFQLEAVSWNKGNMQTKYLKKLQKRCQTIGKVVVQSAEHAVKHLNLCGGNACIKYGFYHVCDNVELIGIRGLDEVDTALRCCRTPCTPMQDIWFEDVVDCKVCYRQFYSVLVHLAQTVFILL